MLMSARKPATIGEILVEEFMQPLGLTQVSLAEAMGVQRRSDLWDAMHSPKELARIERAKPLATAA